MPPDKTPASRVGRRRPRGQGGSLSAGPDGLGDLSGRTSGIAFPVVDFVTGFVRASAEPSTTLSEDEPTLVGLGGRNAVRAGSTIALCGRHLAYVEPDPPFSTGGLDVRACVPCVARADEA